MAHSVQSAWTNWDGLINMDLKWKEIMYGFSPNMMKFWLNSIQNTLPDPCNLRRWGKQKIAECPLCKWKNCTLTHILCSCKMALDQGRISWRHHSILSNIVKHIKKNKVEHDKGTNYAECGDDVENSKRRVNFVKRGVLPRNGGKKHTCYWHGEKPKTGRLGWIHVNNNIQYLRKLLQQACDQTYASTVHQQRKHAS